MAAQSTSQNQPSSREMANAIRALAMDAVEAAQSGHPGMPMGMADIATVLFTEFLNIDPKAPSWPNRDRFVLSAGHGSMLQYALHYLLGYADMPLDQLKAFRQLGAKTAGHPEYGHAEGIETTTGPLGQGFANAVGMALAERMLAAEFGEAAVDHKTYVIVGDGCLMEGISHEAASFAGHHNLNKLVVLWDDNQISIDGPTSLSVSEDTLARFRAYGFNVSAIDGHDENAIRAALKTAQTSDKPSFIACRTTIGYGAPTKAGKSSSHGSPLGKDEIAGARQSLSWAHEPFEIPERILSAWRNSAARGHGVYHNWQKTYGVLPNDKRAEFERRLQGELPSGWQEALRTLKNDVIKANKPEATRKSSENTLNAIADFIPELVGGSADLTGSNNTKTKKMLGLDVKNPAGRYVYYGVREHAMGAIMNGLALHGGFVPYGGTFLVFSDYMRPAIRLSALMRQRVIYVMTHDSIGLGEDGPTHQPVEHVSSLRAMPNVLVFRPADAVETAECWELALASKDKPSVLALTRQNVPVLRTDASTNPSARGGYVLIEDEAATVTLMATGSEVSLAVEARAKLAEKNVKARVVSMPCTELFDAQDAKYRKQVLGSGLRVAIEAAVQYGWDKYLGDDGLFFGVNDFGASGPYQEVYAHFGLTADNIAITTLSALSKK